MLIVWHERCDGGEHLIQMDKTDDCLMKLLLNHVNEKHYRNIFKHSDKLWGPKTASFDRSHVALLIQASHIFSKLRDKPVDREIAHANYFMEENGKFDKQVDWFSSPAFSLGLIKSEQTKIFSFPNFSRSPVRSLGADGQTRADSIKWKLRP